MSYDTVTVDCAVIYKGLAAAATLNRACRIGTDWDHAVHLYQVVWENKSTLSSPSTSFLPLPLLSFAPFLQSPSRSQEISVCLNDSRKILARL